jgi:hypothetical protein
MHVQCTCLTCGTPFWVYPSRLRFAGGGKYCSRACMAASQRGKQPHNYAQVARICATCGQGFSVSPCRVRRTPALYCSHDCRFAAERGGPPIKHKCKNCGKPFSLKPSRAARRGAGQYCSIACKFAQRREWRACALCGKEFSVPRSQSKRFCSAKCQGKANSGPNNHKHNAAGRFVAASGYVWIKAPSGRWRLEHRVVLEQHLGRRLRSSEIVHHRDEDKQNNSLANFEILTRAEHGRRHGSRAYAHIGSRWDRRSESPTAGEWRALCARYEFRCLRCGAQAPTVEITRDHIVPKSRNGPTILTNLQPLCFACNRWKGRNTIDYRTSAFARSLWRRTASIFPVTAQPPCSYIGQGVEYARLAAGMPRGSDRRPAVGSGAAGAPNASAGRDVAAAGTTPAPRR